MATKVQGADALKRKMRVFPQRAREQIARAMEQSAEEIVKLAKSLAPVSPGGGALRDSIGWNWGDAPAGSMVLGTVRTEGKGAGNLAITIYAGDDRAYYSRWVEFGTAPHAQGGLFAGTQHPGLPARPFFFPSYRALRKRTRSRVSRAIRNAARSVAASGG
jgi:HK97 gp10 family phage protein